MDISLQFDSSGGTKHFYYTTIGGCKKSNVTFVPIDEWLTARIGGDGVVDVTAFETDTTSQRIGYVNINLNGTMCQRVRITQAGGDSPQPGDCGCENITLYNKKPPVGDCGCGDITLYDEEPQPDECGCEDITLYDEETPVDECECGDITLYDEEPQPDECGCEDITLVDEEAP